MDVVFFYGVTVKVQALLEISGHSLVICMQLSASSFVADYSWVTTILLMLLCLVFCVFNVCLYLLVSICMQLF